MEGVISGIMYCNQIRDEEINTRLANRNVPSSKLQPYFTLRGVPTKYTHLQVVDRVPPSDVPIEVLPVYNVAKTFNPGTAFAPWSGFAANIDTYSLLRNQFFAIQSCPQADFIPGTRSDLYVSTVPNRGRLITEHPLLGDIPQNLKTSHIPSDKNATFNNSTRTQRINEI